MNQAAALSLISLVSLTATALPGTIARRLGVRVRNHVRLRALLCDYLYGIRPGSAGSLLYGASETELDAFRDRLARELSGAIRDVAEEVESRWRCGLVRLANEIDQSVDAPVEVGEAAEVLKEWITISRLAGTTEIEFLQICQ
jgi:hypothetical protein